MTLLLNHWYVHKELDGAFQVKNIINDYSKLDTWKYEINCHRNGELLGMVSSAIEENNFTEIPKEVADIMRSV